MIETKEYPFLLASSLAAVMAQRLVRLLCPHCKQEHQPGRTECERLHLKQPAPIYRAVGCEQCNHPGYRGRSAAFELIAIDEQTGRLIHDGASEQDILDYAREKSASLSESARDRVMAGDTSLGEVLRVTATIS